MSSSFQDKMATFAESTKHSSGFLVTPRVPQGLAAAVEGLTREIIRNKPEDIYEFAALHFEKLLRLREEYEKSGFPLEKDPRILRDMGVTHLVSPERRRTSTRARIEAGQSGWSLNQTAKVLKRHRSILGDSDASSDHFHPINDNQTPVSTSITPPCLHTCTRTLKNPRKSIPKPSSSCSESQSGDSEPRTTPKIITRMSSTELTSRDIKNELRKNRISSRERKSRPRKTEAEEKRRIEVDNSEAFEGLKRSSRRSDKTRKTEDRRKENGYNSSDKMSRTPSMDKVKDYVVRKFSSTQSLQDLQSLNYVQQVQSIIDETEPIIKDKIEQLKKGIINSRRQSNDVNSRNSEDILENRLNETQKLLESVSSSLSKPPGRSRSARALRRIRSVSMISTEDINGNNHEKNEQFMISELLITNDQREGLDVRIRDSNVLEEVKPRRSHSAKGSRRNIFEPEKSVPDNSVRNEALESMLNETRNILAGISSSLSDQNGYKRSTGSGSCSSSSKSDECDFADLLGLSKVSLPEVRPKSAKNISKNLHKNGVEDFVLPAIPPEVSKSSKIKEELVLPVLSPPGTSNSPKPPEILEIPVEEVFKDSLNVSPEPSDTPQRPDSLEPEERIEDIEPPSELGQKLLEIQNVEREVEKVFGGESVSLPEEIEPTKSDDELKKKLMELMEVEREIENVLNGTNVPSKHEEESLPSHRQSGEQGDEENGSTGTLDDSGDQRKEINHGNGHNEEPEESSHTYVLTEGSPYDIPESVTTVIIPEPPVSPSDEKLPRVSEVDEPEEQQKSSRDPSESFGEEIHPEEKKASLMDLIPSKSDVIIHKQNLQCINEEEGPDDDEALENGRSDPPTSFLDVDETIDRKSSGLDVSDDFTRQECVSMSSTSAKETSITDGPIDTPKNPPDSGEDMTSDSGTAESSNEAKETTLTDGTSFSIDPTRPFVPELNLDSLQDITVSSFKMTEDEYEPGDNENTNSFSETLTPDEGNKIVSGGRGEINSETGEGEEVVLDDQSSVAESLGIKDDEEGQGDVKDSESLDGVVEETCVQKFVEIKEPNCKKRTYHITGSNEDVESSVNRVNPPEEELDLKEDKMDEEKGSESDQGTENFIDEDTPLAVSRSASQCTTRRVSSGNLARLKDDMRLVEGEEETETRDDDVRVKLSGEDQEGVGPSDDSVIGGEEIDLTSVGDDAEDDRRLMENKEYHIYVPEMEESEDSTTESSFNSAATKIQAGVRGFLTRRRLQRMHHLNSTLNGVPSIQDSIVIDERPLESLDLPNKDLLELEGAATTIQSNFRGYKARKRLRREDAMQRTTISMERAFGEDGLRHTGEFHDCIPLPLLDYPPKLLTPPLAKKNPLETDGDDRTSKRTLGMMFGIAPGVPVLQFGLPPKITNLVDLVVLTKDETAVESGYLNFITSVEDAESSPAPPGFFKPPETPGSDVSGESTKEFVDLSPRKGVIIEEITSLEEAKILSEMKAKEKTPETPESPHEEIQHSQSSGDDADAVEEKMETPLEELNEEKSGNKSGIDIVGALEAPLATLGFPIKQGKLLRYGSEDSTASHVRRTLLEVTLTPGDPMKSLSLSQESQLAGERIESPITMMQFVPGRGPSLLQDDSGENLVLEHKMEGGGSPGAPASIEEPKKESRVKN